MMYSSFGIALPSTATRKINTCDDGTEDVIHRIWLTIFVRSALVVGLTVDVMLGLTKDKPGISICFFPAALAATVNLLPGLELTVAVRIHSLINSVIYLRFWAKKYRPELSSAEMPVMLSGV